MSRLRALVAKFPTQAIVFKIEPHHVEEALARWRTPLPSLDIEFCSTEDPAFGERAAAADAMIGYRFPTAEIPRKGSALRLIQLAGAGLEHLLPLDWLPRQVALATASGVHAPKIKEWATMVFLMLHSRLPHFVTAQRAHEWSKEYSSHIAGRTALIFGTGAIGGAVAAAARGLRIRTVGVRRSVRPTRGFDTVISLDQVPQSIAAADFVVLATPLTPATQHIMNADLFGRMRPESGFANFGRGGLVDQDAMMAALRGGALGGAIIDVTEPEPPPPDSPLWDTPRLIITPHISCDDPSTYIPQTLDIFLDNIVRRAAGRAIRNRVIRSRAY
jgi:phosphoglycerate dehydrogenase-like enzyme